MSFELGISVEPHVEAATALVRSCLEHEPAVEAVFLAGSHVIGAAAPGSDVDFTVLSGADGSGRAIVSWLSDAMGTPQLCHGVPQFRHGGVWVSVSAIARRDADEWVEHVFDSAEQLRGSQAVLQHKFVEAVAIRDPNGLLPDYQRKLSYYPDSLACEVTSDAISYLREEYLDDWGFRGAFHFAYCLGDILEHVSLALYALNRRFYMPPLKRLQRDLPTLKPNVERELTELICMSSATDLNAKRDPLAIILNKLQGSVA